MTNTIAFDHLLQRLARVEALLKVTPAAMTGEDVLPPATFDSVLSMAADEVGSVRSDLTTWLLEANGEAIS